ncbi:YlxR family protein [candidate division KSB1 bacterium]|nr:YlxR family protein [candidate division KSB1 bacterium]MBL7095898.1 YlxR family protein [candidate division KSB1 bacterium]
MAQPNWYRKCVGCGTARHKKELLRIALGKNNLLQIDENQTKPGRGTYICPKLTCAKSAQQNHGFEKSLRCQINKSFYHTLICLLRIKM